MTRDDIDTLKARVSIVALIGKDVELKKRGKNWVGLCPFHREKTPSFTVNDEKGFYYCFGCHKSGDVLRWFQDMYGIQFPEAIRELKKMAVLL